MTAKRVAVIGGGYFGRFHLDAWSRMSGVTCEAVADLNPDTAKAAAEEFGFGSWYTDAETMLAGVRPDIIDITTPPHTHFDLIRKAASDGVAIQCQKPFCTSLEEARKAVDCAASVNATLSVHENFRFQPWHRHTKTLLDDKTLGEVYQATFRLRPGDGQGADAYLSRQPYFQKMERFLVRETAIHLIDLFRYLFGEPSGVFANLRRLNPVIKGEDAGLILLEFPDGKTALFDGNRLVDHSTDNTRRTLGEMLIEGSKACLTLDGSGAIRLRAQGSVTGIDHRFDWHDHNFAGDCVYLTCCAFAGHVMHGTPLENSAADYLRNLEIQERVYQSDAEKRWLPL